MWVGDVWLSQRQPRRVLQHEHETRAGQVSQMDTHMHIWNGLGEEGDSQDDDERNDKEDDGKVQVVYTTDNCGTVAGLHAAPSSIGKLSNHTGHPNHKSNDQSPKGSLWKKNLG